MYLLRAHSRLAVSGQNKTGNTNEEDQELNSRKIKNLTREENVMSGVPDK